MKHKHTKSSSKGKSAAPLKKSIAKVKARTKPCYDMGKVIDWIESAVNVDLRSPPTLTPEQIEIRNKKLFPFIKESFLPTDQQRVLIPEEAMGKFLKYLNQLLPELPDLGTLFNTYKKKSSLEGKPELNKKYFIVIRSETPHMHKYETRKKGQHKSSICEDYIDEYDKERMKQQSKHYAESIRPPKWVSVAWDIYTLLYNHNKGLMFHKPVDTVALGCPDYYQVIKNPIDLETIKHKLNLMLYPDLKSFVGDIRTMFKNCYKYNGPTHKLAQHCETIEKRLDKYIAKIISEGKIKEEDV